MRPGAAGAALDYLGWTVSAATHKLGTLAGSSRSVPVGQTGLMRIIVPTPRSP